MQTYSVPISVKGIVFDNNGVWLRKNERDQWELPGGKIDKGEKPDEAVIRELSEELGFKTKVQDIIQAYLHTIQGSQDESNGVLVITYLCKLIEKTGEFEIEGEAGKAKFHKFLIEEINSLNMPDFYKEAIHKAREDK